MSRIAAAGFVVIMGCVGLVAYRLAEPSHLYVAADNRDLLAGMATNQAIELTANAPTKTPWPTSTPTPYPRKPTETPLPTYNPASPEPGVQMVPKWTEVPPAIDEIDAGLPPCVTVTPQPYSDIACEVTK